MKKIIAAWIEQILEFDSNMEYLTFIVDLKKKDSTFQVINETQDKSGKVRIRIIKQYNKNEFPNSNENYGV